MGGESEQKTNRRWKRCALVGLAGAEVTKSSANQNRRAKRRDGVRQEVEEDRVNGGGMEGDREVEERKGRCWRRTGESKHGTYFHEETERERKREE